MNASGIGHEQNADSVHEQLASSNPLRKTKNVMFELGIPFLDLWEAYYLSGDHMENEDGRHYNNEINKLMQSWFYWGQRTEL